MGFSAKIPNDVRRKLYEREGFACALCGDPRDLHIHHVIPRSSGGGNSPMNLIVLCRYCHANAHGLHLSELVIDPEEVEQACVEYVSDMYAGYWDPHETLDYGNGKRSGSGRDLAFHEIAKGVAYLRGVPPMWAGTSYDGR